MVQSPVRVRVHLASMVTAALSAVVVMVAAERLTTVPLPHRAGQMEGGGLFARSEGAPPPGAEHAPYRLRLLQHSKRKFG